MSNNIVQRSPPAVQGHDDRVPCTPRHPLRKHFLSFKPVPAHIPRTPTWLKALPILAILLAFVTMVYSASLNPPELFTSIISGIAVALVSVVLIVQLWATTLYNYYVRIAIDVIFTALWIVALVLEAKKPHSTSHGLDPGNENPQAKTEHRSTFNQGLIVLLALEVVLFVAHLGLSAYYFYLHREAGGHSKVIKDRHGKLITKDIPPPGIWEELSSPTTPVAPEILPARPAPRRRRSDAHVQGNNRLELDPLRMTPFNGLGVQLDNQREPEPANN